MTSYSENLRDQSREMREHVKTMLDRLAARPSFLKDELTQLSLAEGVPENVRNSLQSLANEYGSDSSLYVSLMTGIAGAVTANVFDALADQSEYLSAKGSLKTTVPKLKKTQEFNAKLRILAAKGDWDEFDAHVSNYVEGREETESV